MATEDGELPEGFQELRQRIPALQEEEYWTTQELDDPQLEGRLRAAAFVFQGDELKKFRKNGREKPPTAPAAPVVGTPVNTVLDQAMQNLTLLRI